MIHSILRRHIIKLAIAVFVALGTAGALWWVARIVEARTTRVISAKEQLASYEENKKIFAEESKLLARINERETTLEAYRITPGATPELLSALEALAATQGVEFSIVAVQTPGEGEQQKLIIDFSASGSRAGLDTFLALLSKQTYQVSFARASLFVEDAVTSAPVVAVGTTSTPKTPAATPVQKWSVLASIEVLSY